jgi:integrase
MPTSSRHRREVRIVPRGDNANGARAKTLDTHVLPISAGLVRLYSAYMFDEYGECGSDYVFVNLFAEPYGRPLRYQAVHQLVRKLRSRTGIEFTLHMLRHSRATSCSGTASGWTWWRGCSPTARRRPRRRPTCTSRSATCALS